MSTSFQPARSVSTHRLTPVRSGRLRTNARVVSPAHARLWARALVVQDKLVDLLRPDADGAELALEVLDSVTCTAGGYRVA